MDTSIHVSMLNRYEQEDANAGRPERVLPYIAAALLLLAVVLVIGGLQ